MLKMSRRAACYACPLKRGYSETNFTTSGINTLVAV